MMKPIRAAKRVNRQLTLEEQPKLDRARAETAEGREKILRNERVAMQAWSAMRRDVDQTVAALRSAPGVAATGY